MYSMITETHSGTVVQTLISDELPGAAVERYVRRGFDLSSVPARGTAVLRSGRATVVVTLMHGDRPSDSEHEDVAGEWGPVDATPPF